MKKVYLGIPAFLGTLAAVWGVLTWLDIRPVLSRDLKPVLQKVDANASWIQLTRWKELEAKRLSGGLTPEEKVEYCILSAQLRLKGEGCA